MKTSPFISFQGATENRRLPAKDCSPPQFNRVEGWYIDSSDKTLTTPIPAYSFPAAPTIPATPTRTRVENEVLNIASAGSGYVSGSADVSVTGGGGTGADLSLVVNGTGGIVGAFVTNSGTGYSSAPTVALRTIGDGGAGAGGSITIVHWALTDYTAWFELGAYVVLLGATGHTRRIRWCAPGRPSVWDQYELEGDIEVLTGAGFVDLPGTGALESAVALGANGVLFDAEGIGVLSLTGDWEAPFSYAKTLNGVTAESDTRYLDGLAVFAGNDGRIWQTNGFSVTPMDGPCDLDKIYNVTWPPSSTHASFAFNTATGHFVVHPYHASGNGVNVWVDRETGAYAADDGDDSTKHIITGVLPIVSEAERTHIQRVRVFTQVSGSFTGNCTMTVGMKGVHETTWHTSSSYNIGTASTAGEYETDVEVNAVYKQPQLKITVVTQSGATVKLQGIVLIYDTGGFR